MGPQLIIRVTRYGLLALALLAQAVSAQQAPATHTIFMNAVEYKSSTTTENLALPQVNQEKIS